MSPRQASEIPPTLYWRRGPCHNCRTDWWILDRTIAQRTRNRRARYSCWACGADEWYDAADRPAGPPEVGCLADIPVDSETGCRQAPPPVQADPHRG